MSILLVSLLRGVGYDAYVVSGYASRSITTMNQTKTSSKPLPKVFYSGSAAVVAPAPVEAETLPSKYRVKPPKQLNSAYILKQEARKKLAEEKRDADIRLEEFKRREPIVDDDDDDELKGLRIHSWVLVLPGRREISEAFFIEPSTGLIHQTTDKNFLGLESVFNGTNYWVNMQVCYSGLQEISFDLPDNAKWEFVLFDRTQTGKAAEQREKHKTDTGNNSDDDEVDENQSSVVDVPPSWVDKLVVTRQQFESRCPTGSKMALYKNAQWVVSD